MFHMADVAAWMMGNLLGSTHVIVPAFEPGAVARAMAEHDVTDALLVPTMLRLLADSPAAREVDLSGVKGVMYGASPMSEAVERSTKLLPNASFAQAHGMTELAPVATLLRPDDHHDATRRRSAGRSTIGNEVRIVDLDDRELPRGEVGEIVVRGDQVMLGYWNKPEETAFALRGGFMQTGDAGYMDEDGFVFVVDRIKDMIVTGGENVYSVEVENALARHPAVASCAVIGIPSETYGEQVHAVVVLQPGAEVDERRQGAQAPAPAGPTGPTAAPRSTSPLPSSSPLVGRLSSGPRAQQRDAVAGEVVQNRLAARASKQQRQQWPLYLRAGAMCPVGVGGYQRDAVDAAFGADDGVRALVEVEYLAHGVGGIGVRDS